MKKLLLIPALAVSLFASIGDNGSIIDSDEVKLEVKLIKDDNTSVTVLDGSKYLKINGESSTSTSIGQALEGTKPPAGTYTKIQWTPKGFRKKAKIVKNGTTYYTKDITVPEDDTTIWNLSTDPNDYASTTITQGAVTHTVTVKFPTPLVIEDGKPVELYYLSKFTGDVFYSDGGSNNPANSTWISNIMEAFSFVAQKPTKMAQFDLVYNKGGTDYKNKITLFLDDNNNILGSYSSEGTGGAEGALSGGFVIENNQTNNHYTIKVDGEDITQTVSFDLDCTNQTYSNLTVDQWHTSNPDMTGGTLTTSGTATCSNITIP